jgi:hypothetical protein
LVKKLVSIEESIGDLGYFNWLLLFNPLLNLIQDLFLVHVMTHKVHVDLSRLIMLDSLTELESEPIEGNDLHFIYHQNNLASGPFHSLPIILVSPLVFLHDILVSNTSLTDLSITIHVDQVVVLDANQHLNNILDLNT